MNRVVLTGRLTRDPEMRSLASGKTSPRSVMQFTQLCHRACATSRPRPNIATRPHRCRGLHGLVERTASGVD